MTPDHLDARRAFLQTGAGVLLFGMGAFAPKLGAKPKETTPQKSLRELIEEKYGVLLAYQAFNREELKTLDDTFNNLPTTFFGQGRFNFPVTVYLSPAEKPYPERGFNVVNLDRSKLTGQNPERFMEHVVRQFIWLLPQRSGNEIDIWETWFKNMEELLELNDFSAFTRKYEILAEKTVNMASRYIDLKTGKQKREPESDLEIDEANFALPMYFALDTRKLHYPDFKANFPDKFIGTVGAHYTLGEEFFTRWYQQFFRPKQVDQLYLFAKRNIFDGWVYARNIKLRQDLQPKLEQK